MKKLFKKSILGSKKCQWLFSRLFEISLQGLNIGSGGRHPKDNGEIYALKYILKKTPEKDGIVIFDGGAQIGMYTDCALEELGEAKKNGTIYGFEAGKKEYTEYARKFLARPSVIPCEVALSDKIGMSTFYNDDHSTGFGSLYPHEKNRTGVTTVPSITIDEFVRRKNIQKINFLKLDVEGNELKVLLGAQSMIQNKKIDFIQFEFGICSLHAQVTFRDIFDLLKGKYKISRILVNGLEEISSPGKLEETFYTTNYLAERIWEN